MTASVIDFRAIMVARDVAVQMARDIAQERVAFLAQAIETWADPVRAAPILRDAGTMEVESQAERRRLADLLTVRLPDIRVRPTIRSAAA